MMKASVSMRPVSFLFVPSARTVKLSPPAMRKELDAIVYVAASSIRAP